MSEIVADPAASPALRGRDQMRWTVLGSIGIHLAIFGILMLPRLPLAEPPSPPPINVDIIPASQAPSLEPSSEAASSVPSSQEASKVVSSFQPSQAPSSAPASSAASAPASAASREGASSPPISSAAASEEPPKPLPAPRGGKVIVPVGASEASAASDASDTASDASASAASAESGSSAASDALASLLTASGEGGAAADSSAMQAVGISQPPTVSVLGGGKLHPAHHFYLKEMLAAPFLSQAKAALKQLSPARRLAQTCNIEATGQAGGAGYQADAIIANAFAPPVAEGTSYAVSGGVFRSQGRWYRIAYQCTLNADMTNVAAFSFHIGDDVTDEITARLSGAK